MMKLETITRTIVGLGIAAVCATAQTRADQPCDDCGPGEYWIDGCGAGTDNIPSSAEVGIYLTDDCTGDPISNFVLFGPATVTRKAEGDPIAGEIETEIVDMSLEGGGATLIVGDANGLPESIGKIIQTGDPRIGRSSFDIFFEFYDARIGYVYNQDPLVVQANITCVPPKAKYIHPEGQCIPLYDAPVGGIVVAYLGDAVHQTFPSHIPIPTLSEWAAIVMTLLFLVAGTIVFLRKRGRESPVA